MLRWFRCQIFVYLKYLFKLIFLIFKVITLGHQWAENQNTSLTFSVGLKVAVDWWRCDITHTAWSVAHWCCTAFPGWKSGGESWKVKVVWTRTHGNVVVLGAVSQGSIERGGGGARVHRHVVVFRISTVWAGKWSFFSLSKDVRTKLKLGSHCRIFTTLHSLMLYTVKKRWCMFKRNIPCRNWSHHWQILLIDQSYWNSVDADCWSQTRILQRR